jgi:cell wall assembly regulator SMI1
MDRNRPQTQDSTAELLALERFTRALSERPDFQRRLAACTTAEQITALAAELNCSVSTEMLRSYSRDLAADHWPWADKGTAWRRAFFSRS